MPSHTPKLNMTYPSRTENPFYTSLESFITAVDRHLFASNEDRSLIFLGGGTLSWDAGTGEFSWSEDIQVITPTTGKLQTLAASSLTVTEGSMMLLSLTRGATTAISLTATTGSYAAATASALVFAYRNGDELVLRTGQVLIDGDETALDTSQRTDVSETFELDNETWEFELATPPHALSDTQVWIEGMLMTSGYTLDGVDLTIEEYPVYVDVDGWIVTVRYQV
jgi:hypothetical protein